MNVEKLPTFIYSVPIYKHPFIRDKGCLYIGAEGVLVLICCRHEIK